MRPWTWKTFYNVMWQHQCSIIISEGKKLIWGNELSKNVWNKGVLFLFSILFHIFWVTKRLEGVTKVNSSQRQNLGVLGTYICNNKPAHWIMIWPLFLEQWFWDYKINKWRWFIVHYASLTCNFTPPQHTLQSTYNQSQSLGLNHYLDSLGSKGLLQPTLGSTIAWAICTLIEYVIFAHSATGRTRSDDQYSQLK